MAAETESSNQRSNTDLASDGDGSFWKRAKQFLPRLTVFQTIATYNSDGAAKERFLGDFAAGLVVAVMLIPQGMAYALLAGMPPMYGLYSSIVSLLIYPLFSTSPQLAVGPVAMVSLLTSAAIDTLGAQTQSERYIELALLMAFLVGVIQLLMGLFHAGYLVNFLSHPVLKGFTSAAGMTVTFQIVPFLMLFLQQSSLLHPNWAKCWASRSHAVNMCTTFTRTPLKTSIKHTS